MNPAPSLVAPVRLAMLVSGRMFGGGQKVVLDLLQAMAGDPTKLVPSLWLMGQQGVMLAYSATVIQYDGNYASLRTIVATVRALRRELVRNRISVVHSHGWDADLFAWLATRRTGIRHLVHLHVIAGWLDSNAWRQRARRFLARKLLSAPGTKVVAVSSAVRKHWSEGLQLPPNAITVIHNGVDTQRFSPAESGSPSAGPLVLGVVARLVAGKGLEQMLEALAIRRAAPVRLKVAGEGPDREAMEERALALGVADKVEFVGFTSDMPGFYRSIDVYVQPSLSEGMPLGLLEAMACGKPVIATDVGGTCEAARDGVDGLIVAPDDVSGLALAINELANSPEKRAAMGRNAHDRISSSFSLGRCASEVERHCLELVARPV